MKSSLGRPLKPNDRRASIAVDLGAESCRVSLLRWKDGRAAIELVHRFPNNPREIDGGLRWDRLGTHLVPVSAEFAYQGFPGAGTGQQTAIGGQRIERAEEAKTLDQLTHEGVYRNHPFGL